jgi:hypothetical protein
MPDPATVIANLPLIPVLSAAIMSWLFSALWYALLGKVWLSALGTTRDEVMGGTARPSPIPLVLSLKGTARAPEMHPAARNTATPRPRGDL